MDDSRIFIVGAKGQLGTALRAIYPNAKSADIDELDITDLDSVAAFDWSDIDVILNAAAFTNVDGAETTEGRLASWRVNATAVSYLAQVCSEHDMTLVHISSDYVFDGTAVPHTEEEQYSPLSVYGASKAAGDIAVSMTKKHYLLRTSWVIGEGHNFVKTMKSLAEKGVEPTVVSDQIGRLTFTSDLADAINHLLSTNQAYGTYNLTNDGAPASWADIAKLVYEAAGYDPSSVTPVTTAEYYAGKEGIAPRPLQSTLDIAKIQNAGFTPRDWHTALKEYMDRLGQEGTN